MRTIKTIDLWTEQYENHYECFNGAFVDGVTLDSMPFDSYKVIRNCNCIITIDRSDLHIRNKHQAIVFYKDNYPVRLVVLNAQTNISRCIEVAMDQPFLTGKLKDLYKKFNITSSMIDLHEDYIDNDCDKAKELDVGSCDRWPLLYNMLKGSYTESETAYGNHESDNYAFIPNLQVNYGLVTDTEKFVITHKCAFINVLETRLIPIQENSPLTSNR